MNYHVGRAGQQLGTFTETAIREKLSSGEFKTDDLGWTEGMAEWSPLGTLFPPRYAPPMSPGAETAPPPIFQPHSATTLGPKPGNNLVVAILVTLFCCLPLGIPSIIFAAQVDSKYASGDYAGAVDAARKSKTWMWWSVGVGLFFQIGYIALMMIGMAGSMAQGGGF